jgi:DNA-binding transcriptional regulator YiaG
MKICNCKKSKPFKSETVLFKPKMRGRGKSQTFQEYPVSIQVTICENCSCFIYGKKEKDAILRLANEARRKDLGFLTGDEIQALREKLGLSRRLFAKYLRFSTRSIELWEIRNQPYEASNDELIRIKCSDAFIKAHSKELEELKKQIA